MMASINQLSDLTGFDRATVRKRLGQLAPQPGPKRAHLYESRDALPLLYGIGAGGGDALNPQQEKAQLDRERRLILEIERAEKEGRMIDKDVAKEKWRAVGMKLNNRAMNMPTTISPSLVGKDQRAIELELKSAIVKMLRGLGDDL